MIKLDKLFLFLMLVSGLTLQAQDIHFSQYNASPLTLNPALTGNFGCTYRAGINYRNQWNSVTTPFVTYSGFFDMPLPFKGFSENDRIGVGALLFNDKSGDGNLSNFSVHISGAYHKGLGDNNNHTLSLGVQLGFMQKKLDQENLLFGNQFNGSEFDPVGLPSFEPFSDNSFGRFDLNLGLVYKATLLDDDLLVEAGGSVNHLTTPKESFLGNEQNELGMRYVAHARAVYHINDAFSLRPTMLFQTQSKAKEVVFGSDFGYYVEGSSFQATFFLGAHYRLDDAVILATGFDYKNFRLGFSYDVNTSSLKEASNNKGGFELALTYTGCVLPVVPKEYVMPCPRY